MANAAYRCQAKPNTVLGKRTLFRQSGVLEFEGAPMHRDPHTGPNSGPNSGPDPGPNSGPHPQRSARRQNCQCRLPSFRQSLPLQGCAISRYDPRPLIWPQAPASGQASFDQSNSDGASPQGSTKPRDRRNQRECVTWLQDQQRRRQIRPRPTTGSR